VVNGDNHRSGLLAPPSSSVLVKIAGPANRHRFRVVDGVLDEGEELVVFIWAEMGRD